MAILKTIENTSLFEDAFLSRIIKGDPVECWLWAGTKTIASKPGNLTYGIFCLGGSTRNRSEKRIYAHRFAYLHFIGAIPDGMFVCHSCDNPLCVNPKHLFLGSAKENHKDMVNKGRQCYPPRKIGEECNSAKLSEEQAQYILDSILPTCELTRIFNVSRSTIKLIRQGKRWKHLRAATI